MTAPRFLILSGDGINCERETAQAFKLAGGDADIVHVNDLMEAPFRLGHYQGLAIPGGFSFGDELGSGQVLALKIRHGLMQEFFRFVDAGRPILGICNGFQVLVKLGLLPDYKEERSIALAQNVHGRFIDRWVNLEVNEKSVCLWTKDLAGRLPIPVRHGEGRLVFKPGHENELYQRLEKHDQIVFRYESDINGSYDRIAGLTDPRGLILGMMPHPEATVSSLTGKLHSNSPGEGMGLLLFKNIIQYLKES